jgi:hypothetical protein
VLEVESTGGACRDWDDVAQTGTAADVRKGRVPFGIPPLRAPPVYWMFSVMTLLAPAALFRVFVVRTRNR